MTYLYGYRVKLKPITKFGKLKLLWYRIKATILGRIIQIDHVIKIQVHINGEPLIHGDLEMCVVPGGVEILYPTPFLVRDTDKVELKMKNLSETAIASVEFIMAEPEHWGMK